MNKITVTKDRLLKIIHGNREDHEAAYEGAVNKYLKQAATEVAKMAADIKKGKFPNGHLKSLRPVQYLKEYDRAIRMLEMHTEPTISLDETAYAQFVDDEWEWKHHFTSNTLSYGK